MPRWIQCPETNKLIPADEYVRPRQKTHLVMEDIKPFVSTVDGTIISTRPQLEAHNRRHNVTNSADFSPEYVEKRGKAIKSAQAREGREQRIAAMQRYLTERE